MSTPVTQRRDLPFVSPRILSRIKPYDLCDRVLSKEPYIFGRGAFSDVFRGLYCDLTGKKVRIAMKRLRLHVNAEECKRLFEKEIYVWSKLIHANVLPLLGYAFEADTGYPMLISEWMDNGNAFSYVKENEPPDDRILEIIFDVAKGVKYLHLKDHAVIHSDIKPENIVISPTGVAMLCDFGCARTEVATCSIAAPTAANARGTCRYWAPELFERLDDVLKAHTVYTDTWAFGMTIYALLSRLVPYSNYAEPGAIRAITHRQLPTFPECHSIQSELLQSIAQGCWKIEPSERTSASKIVNKLQRICLPDLERSPSSSTNRPSSNSTVTRDQDNGSNENSELEGRIKFCQAILDRRPPGHLYRDFALFYLAYAVGNRYARYNEVINLEDSIQLFQESLDLRPPGDPCRHSSLFGLAYAISHRYARYSRIADLETSSQLHQEALELRPPGHPNRSLSLDGLGCAFRNRYLRYRIESDMETSIQMFQAALELRPPGYPHRDSSLSGLGHALSDRYERYTKLSDLKRSIQVHEEALELRPAGHPNRPFSLDGLGHAIGHRYARLGELSDLEKCIELHQEALELCPPGHPRRASSLRRLAKALDDQYAMTGDVADEAEE